MPLRIWHIITGLNTGGAEIMLYRLLSRSDRHIYEHSVVSLMDIGPVGVRIQALGVSVRALGLPRGGLDPLAVLRLIRWLRGAKPDIVQTWMYHANLVGGVAAALAGVRTIIWSIHHTNLDPRWIKRSTIWTAKTCARLSRWIPARIVCCSDSARDVHARLGYAAEKMVVIPNGFDLGAFRPDPAARSSLRQELGLAAEAPLVGLVARFHPQKDHRNFVQAATLLRQWLASVHFVCCGDGVTAENAELSGWIREEGLGGVVHLLGRRSDMPRINAGLDVASSSSFGEAFPLVVGEAMACGVPCVVTGVGDSAYIVGETGIVVPPRDPQALAEGWLRLLTLTREERIRLGALARDRIAARFGLDHIVCEYARLYEAESRT